MCVVICVSTPHSKPEELAVLVIALSSLVGVVRKKHADIFLQDYSGKRIATISFGGVVDAPLCSLAVCVIDQGAALECQLAPLTYATVV